MKAEGLAGTPRWDKWSRRQSAERRRPARTRRRISAESAGAFFESGRSSAWDVRGAAAEAHERGLARLRGLRGLEFRKWGCFRAATGEEVEAMAMAMASVSFWREEATRWTG